MRVSGTLHIISLLKLHLVCKACIKSANIACVAHNAMKTAYEFFADSVLWKVVRLKANK